MMPNGLIRRPVNGHAVCQPRRKVDIRRDVAELLCLRDRSIECEARFPKIAIHARYQCQFALCPVLPFLIAGFDGDCEDFVPILRGCDGVRIQIDVAQQGETADSQGGVVLGNRHGESVYDLCAHCAVGAILKITMQSAKFRVHFVSGVPGAVILGFGLGI